MAGGDLNRVAELEQLPIDSLWTGGHVASPNPSPEALMSLARLSAVTRRVKIGTAILLLPLYQPAIVAKQVADLDRETGGRLILGVGVGGEYAQEFRACGVPMEERGRRVDEAIPLLRRLWTAREITHVGRYYAMNEVKIHPPPAQPGGPPIVLAGRKEAAMRRAALIGDGWMPYLYSPGRYAASVTRIHEFAEAANRDLDEFEWYAFVFVNIGANGQRARQELAATLGGLYNQDFREMLDHVAAAGTPEQVLNKVQDFVDAGARHLIFVPPVGAGDPSAVVDLLLTEVVPHLRT
jgi:probable F420-dependent oxidoreductase